MLKKIIISIINLLIYYLIIKINYANFLLIKKLIILDIKFQVFKITNFVNNSIINLI